MFELVLKVSAYNLADSTVLFIKGAKAFNGYWIVLIFFPYFTQLHLAGHSMVVFYLC